MESIQDIKTINQAIQKLIEEKRIKDASSDVKLSQHDDDDEQLLSRLLSQVPNKLPFTQIFLGKSFLFVRYMFIESTKPRFQKHPFVLFEHITVYPISNCLVCTL